MALFRFLADLSLENLLVPLDPILKLFGNFGVNLVYFWPILSVFWSDLEIVGQFGHFYTAMNLAI